MHRSNPVFSLRRVIGYVSGDNTPALRHSYPGLTLSPISGKARPFGFAVRHREITAKCRNKRPQNRALDTLDVARPPECGDCGVPYQGSVGTVTQGVLAAPKQGVEDIEIIGPESLLVAPVGFSDLGDNLGDIDLEAHYASLGVRHSLTQSVNADSRAVIGIENTS
jgi:hypothetical protein